MNFPVASAVFGWPSPSISSALCAFVVQYHSLQDGLPHHGRMPVRTCRGDPNAPSTIAFWSAWLWLILPSGAARIITCTFSAGFIMAECRETQPAPRNHFAWGQVDGGRAVTLGGA